MDRVRPTNYPTQSGAYSNEPIPAVSSNIDIPPKYGGAQGGAVGVTSGTSFFKSKIFIAILVVVGIILGLGLIAGIILIAVYAASKISYRLKTQTLASYKC